MTLEEIGTKFDLTRERVRQRSRKRQYAGSKVRNHVYSKRISDNNNVMW